MPAQSAQSCLTLCDPIDCSPPGSSVHGDSPGKSTGVGCHVLLQDSSVYNASFLSTLVGLIIFYLSLESMPACGYAFV